VYRREIVETLLRRFGEIASRGIMMLAAIAIRPLGMHGGVLWPVSGTCR
jgi:hypothetical protein